MTNVTSTFFHWPVSEERPCRSRLSPGKEFGTGNLGCFWEPEDSPLRWRPVSAGRTEADSGVSLSSPGGNQRDSSLGLTLMNQTHIFKLDIFWNSSALNWTQEVFDKKSNNKNCLWWEWQTCEGCDGLWKGLRDAVVFFSGWGATGRSGLKYMKSQMVKHIEIQISIKFVFTFWHKTVLILKYFTDWCLRIYVTFFLILFMVIIIKFI